MATILNRMPNNAMLVVTGPRQNGKTATIRSLIGQPDREIKESQEISLSDELTVVKFKITLSGGVTSPSEDMKEFFRNNTTLPEDTCPNLVLLVVNATETRLSDKNGDFQKCLAVIRDSELVRFGPNGNLLIVGTNAGSLPDGPIFSEVTAGIIRSILDGNDYMSQVPVVFLENGHLPDNSRCLLPEDLRQKIIDFLQGNGDSVGKHLFESYFNGLPI